MTKTLIVLAHPNLQASNVNKAMFEKASKMKDITFLNLYEKYKDCSISASLPKEKIKEDQNLMQKSEKIVLQFPFYWYSTPALLKQWLDDVLQYGWAHHGGVVGEKYALEGKELALAIVCGGNEDSYIPTGYNQASINHFLDPFVQTARTLKMEMKQPFVIYGSMTISKPDLEKKALEYTSFLQK